MQPVPAREPAAVRVRLRAPVFVSDLHLCAQRPRTLARFCALLYEIAGQAAELVILGDLFEYWVGDDELDAGAGADEAGAQAAAALARLAARGTEVWLMRGNRDVLLGGRFLRASGARLLADAVHAEFADASAQPATLLAHGDAYCTLDLRYQAFRRRAHSALLQGLFLALPIARRRALIGEGRARSEADKKHAAMEIMDVTPGAIEQALRAAGVRRMIHGHTHRPARHELRVDGEPAVRQVLPDWDLDAAPARGGGLRWTARGLEAFALD